METGALLLETGGPVDHRHQVSGVLVDHHQIGTLWGPQDGVLTLMTGVLTPGVLLTGGRREIGHNGVHPGHQDLLGLHHRGTDPQTHGARNHHLWAHLPLAFPLHILQEYLLLLWSHLQVCLLQVCLLQVYLLLDSLPLDSLLLVCLLLDCLLQGSPLQASLPQTSIRATRLGPGRRRALRRPQKNLPG